MRNRMCIALAGALLTVAPVRAHSQTLAPPALPASTLTTGIFEHVLGAFGFKQCTDGVIVLPDGSTTIVPVVCAAGLMTVGTRPLGGGQTNINVWLDLMLTADPRVRPTDIRGLVSGVASGPMLFPRSCGVGCLEGGILGIHTTRGNLVTVGTMADTDPLPTVDMTRALLFVDYSMGRGDASTAILAATITPVPEPSTYAMLGSGLLVLGAVAWSRRRRTA